MTLVSNIEDLTEAIRDKLNLMNNALRPAAITIVVDGGGYDINGGVKLDVIVPFDCVIESWSILADQIGSVSFDLWKTDFVNAPPVSNNSIVGSNHPVLSSDIKAQSTDLASWNTTLLNGDVIRVNIDSVNVVTRLTLILQVMRA